MDLIQMLTERVGVSSDQAEQGAGVVFQKLKESLDGGDFSRIAEAIPGLDGMLEKAPAAEAAEAGGLMGMIGGAASKLGLGAVGDMADLAAGFDKIGLDASQLSGFVSTIIDFVEQKLGVDGRSLIEKFLK